MTWEIWIAYVATTTILLMIPGPTVLLVIGHAISGGRRTAWWTVPGVVLGDAVAMVGSLAGLGALLAVSGTVFTLLKWLGAAYLVYLGIRMWRRVEPPTEIAPGPKAERSFSLLTHAFAVTALNPKSITFFIAFLPQFISPLSPATPQPFILGTTFLVLAFINIVAYAILAGEARDRLRHRHFFAFVNRIGGSLLIGAGILMAALRQSA